MRHAVPHRTQSNTYNCGPTCLEMLLDFYGVSYDPAEMETICDATPGKGTDNDNLVRAIEAAGMQPTVKENASLEDIVETIKSGHPVLVNYFNCKSHVGHYAVIKGIDFDVGALLLADPKQGDDYPLTFDHFQKHWHNHTKTIHAWMMYIQVN